MCYSLLLQSYDLHFQHLAGKLHPCDYLSRIEYVTRDEKEGPIWGIFPHDHLNITASQDWIDYKAQQCDVSIQTENIVAPTQSPIDDCIAILATADSDISNEHGLHSTQDQNMVIIQHYWTSLHRLMI